jgi:hypothetical protein
VFPQSVQEETAALYNWTFFGGPVKKQSTYKVQVKVGDAEIVVEGGESGVVKIVEALSEMLRTPSRRVGSYPVVNPATLISPAYNTQPKSGPSAETNIRSFFEEKKPSSDIEAAVVAAYFYQYLVPESERKATIDSALLQDAFRLAKRPLPARTIYTLTNARNAGYLDSVGEGGQFKLNAVGYNLVEHGLGSGGEKAKRRIKKRRT